MKEGKFNQYEYINQYKREKYERMELLVPKGKKAAIKEHAKAKGYKSVNEYINTLINEDMKEQS